MGLKRVQRAYANTLFDMAIENNCLQAVQEDMQGMASAIRSVSELAKFIKDYSISRKKRMKCLQAIFEKKVHPLTWHFLLLVERRRRMGWLTELCSIFNELYLQRNGIIRVYMHSAFLLDKQDQLEIEKKIEAKMGLNVRSEVTVHPELIGGFTIIIGDLLYDWSIAGCLKRLRKIFAV